VEIRGKAFGSINAGDELPFVKSVKFGPTNATSFEVHAPGLPGEEPFITAVAPGGTGTVDVTVETYGGTSPTSAADQFTYAEPPPRPTVTKVEPSSGTATGGTSVTITGERFTGATAVKFGSTNAVSFTVNSSTSITAASPAGTGTVDVTVTTASGTSATSEADQFTYVERLAVTRVEPNHGSPGGGTTVTITGTGFTGTTAVNFGATSAKSFTVNSATSITAVSPKGKGTVDVTVTTPAGTSPTSAADQFTYSKK
jgi:hypothetical protein